MLSMPVTPRRTVTIRPLAPTDLAAVVAIDAANEGRTRRDYIERRYGRAFWVLMAPELLAMRAIGATRHDADAIRLTHRGMYCWVLMMAEFFNSVNSVREQMRENIRVELETWNEEAKVPLSSITGLSRGAGP